MRSGTLVGLLLAVAVPLVSRAADAPHENGDAFCSNCHMAHNAPGASLTSKAGNFNLCNSCHLSSQNFGFPWTVLIQAVPGTSGRSHRWDANASSMGATPPNIGSTDLDEQEMAKRLDGGNLMCSTCHDVHDADFQPVLGRGRQTVSAVTKLDAVPGPSGNGTLSVAAVDPAATAKFYLVDVVAAGAETTALYRLSNDKGKSWFGCTTPATYTYVAWDATNGCQAGASVPLNDGANVNVAFAPGSYAIGDRFSFYVSYPFLRADTTNSKMCVICHKDRNMSAANVQGSGTHAGTGAAIVPGTTVFHHPVGTSVTVTVAGMPLDANGVAQSGAGDGDPSNDLVLGEGGVVSCLTCHRVHNADSNSLTPDP
jgi:predicted CXXCH cytochrome family protein